jgi:hypothetical protein
MAVRLQTTLYFYLYTGHKRARQQPYVIDSTNLAP